MLTVPISAPRDEIRQSVATHQRPYAIAKTSAASPDVILMLGHDLGNKAVNASRTAIATAKAAAGVKVKGMTQNDQVVCLRVAESDASRIAVAMKAQSPEQAATFRANLDSPITITPRRAH